MSIRSLAVMTFAALLLSGCENTTSTGASVVSRSQMMLVSSESFANEAAKAYTQVLAQARQQGALDANPTLTRRVSNVAARLIKQAPYFREDCKKWQWEVHVITSDELNAWCMAGGKMAVYSGIVEKLQLTDDEIAVIMGHEITHALREHIREQQSQAAVKNGLLSVASLFGVDGGLLGIADTLANVGLTLPFSRQHETEADEIGLELMYRAGFNPDAGVTVWEKMQKAAGSGQVELLSTHPSNENRIENLRELSAKLKAQRMS